MGDIDTTSLLLSFFVEVSDLATVVEVCDGALLT